MSLRGTWCRGTLCGSKWALKDAKGAYMGHVKRQGVLGGGIKGAAAKGLTNGGLRAAAPGGAAGGLTQEQQPTTSSCTSTPRTSRTRGRRRWSSRRPCSSTVRRRTGAGGLAEGLTPRPLLPPAVDMFYESSGVVSVGADGLRLTCCDVYCCGEYTRAAAHVCGRGGGLTETQAASSRAAPTPAPSIAAAAAGRTSRSCRSRCGCERRPAAAAPSIVYFFRLPQTVVDSLRTPNATATTPAAATTPPPSLRRRPPRAPAPPRSRRPRAPAPPRSRRPRSPWPPSSRAWRTCSCTCPSPSGCTPSAPS